MKSLQTLALIEETALSIWLRESGIAFFGSLTLHSLSMAFVVGINIAVAIRLIGFAPKLEISPLARFYTMHWYAVVLIFISGVALLLAYPAKALTNPVFYVKLCALGLGLTIAKYFHSRFTQSLSQPIDTRVKRLALASLLMWLVVVTAGRFLAYTHNTLLASRFF